jgi:solute carrier family 26 (sodium-independent sulfate anion transporter), member 11
MSNISLPYMQFHFAPILSPWIRRALLAGGFGLGISASHIPRDLAAVVPYRGGRSDISSGLELHPVEDAEVGYVKKSPTTQNDKYQPIVPDNTPFFHIDLQSAVRAAESGISS